MASNQVHLKLGEVRVRDSDLREVTETGVDAVDGSARLGLRFDEGSGSRDAFARGLAHGDANLSLGDPADVLQRKSLSVDAQIAHRAGTCDLAESESRPARVAIAPGDSISRGCLNAAVRRSFLRTLPLPRPPAPAALVVDLARIVGAPHVSNRDVDRLAYSHDAWTRDVMLLRTGEVPAAPECVVWPGTAEEVAEVLALAVDRSIVVVPYGAGASMVGSARPSSGGLVIDLKRMRTIRRLDETNLRVEVEAGIIGERLEQHLNARGYTLGHLPPSLGSSTVGGWLATRSAGQMSTRYGKIEDIALGLQVATQDGVQRVTSKPRPADGVDFTALLMGSEGTLGVITAAELRIRPLPVSSSYFGVRFASVTAGLEAVRQIMQAGLRPSVLRLYDGADTLVGLVPGSAGLRDESRALDPLTDRAQSLFDDLTRRVPGWNASGRFADRMRKTLMRGTVKAVMGAPMVLNRALEALPDDCMLVMGFEGQPALVAAELAAAQAIANKTGGVDLGSEPGEQWLKNRGNAAFRQSKLFASGLFMDTFEAVATWDRLLPMYRSVKKAIAADAVVTAHFAHAYTTGCAVSFTFAGAGADLRDARGGLTRYDRILRHALQAVHETGGSVAHHQGIGEARAQAMTREHGPGVMRVLTAVKHGLDPAGIMNPGKLGLKSTFTMSPNRIRIADADEAGFADAVVAAVGERNVTISGTRTTIRPPDEGALAAVLRVAHRRGLSISTDQTGFRPRPKFVQLDLRRLDGVSRISGHGLFVEAEAGVIVHRLEALLQQHDLTLGPLHPRSLLRTLGAALARNLLIRRSVRDGDLGGLCMRVRGLLANGAVFETRLVPRSAAGPAIARAFVGGQGRLGVITQAVLRVRSVPRHVADVGYRVADLEAALAVARRTLQRDVRPWAARLIPDATNGAAGAANGAAGAAHAANSAPGGVCVALRLVGASADHLRAQQAILRSAAREFDAVDLEEARGLAEGGIFDAVIEAPTTWSQAKAAVAAVQAAGSAEVWLDFLSPEGLTLVARVPDPDVRRSVATALAALPAPLVAGSPVDLKAPFEAALDRTAMLLDPSGVFRPRDRS